MIKNKAKLLAAAVAMGMSVQASAAIELYNQDNTTFAVDGYFNAFYTNEDNDATGEKQNRVRMGFLPNWIGFNFGKQVNDLKLGGRSSFWVTINDGHENVTETAIDVRQFYGTVDGDWGQVLIGKDFGLYGRANIFNDAILMGAGLPNDSVVDAIGRPSGVTYGNIGIGYQYAAPVAQITYRSPVNNGFQFAAGLMDPESGENVDAGESQDIRFETEITYNTEVEGGTFGAWINAAWGESGTCSGLLGGTGNAVCGLDAGEDERGIGWGLMGGMGGFKATVSGFDSEGLTVTTGTTAANGDYDEQGLMVQLQYTAGDHRFVYSHAELEQADVDTLEQDIIAYFYSVNSNLILVGEYTTLENESVANTDVDQIAVGAIVTF